MMGGRVSASRIRRAPREPRPRSRATATSLRRWSAAATRTSQRTATSSRLAWAMSSGTVMPAWALPTRTCSAIAGRPLRAVTVSATWVPDRSTPIGSRTRSATVAPSGPI